MARTLDSDRELTLMLCAGAGNSSGKNLSALGDILSQASDVLVIDFVDMIRAELADLLLSAHSRAKRLCSVSFGSLFIHLSLPPVYFLKPRPIAAVRTGARPQRR